MSEQDRFKRQAAVRAVDFVEDGMVVGLGTGSTAAHALAVLAERLEREELHGVVGVPTSRETELRAVELGVPLVSLEREPRIDLTIDGADEIAPGLRLIKGLGGALLWEKIVATASDRMIVVADEGKVVERLGQKAPVPVEVVPFGWTTLLPYLDLLGAHAVLRRDAKGNPLVTDGGHYLLDCRFEEGLLEPERIERELRERVGIVETGLFLGLADTAVVAGPDGVRLLAAEDG